MIQSWLYDLLGADDAWAAGLLGFGRRYQRLSAVGDLLEKLNGIIPWSVFEKPLAKALKRSDGGGPCLSVDSDVQNPGAAGTL